MGNHDGKIIVPYYLLENKKSGTGKGLNRTLFEDTEWQKPISEQLGQVDVNTEDVAVSADQLGIRYSGILETKYAKAYTLHLTTSGLTKMWINEELVLETTSNASPTEVQVNLDLLATHKYRIKIEGIYETPLVVTKLEWSSENQDRELIPLNALYGELQGLPPYEPEPPVINSAGKEFNQAVSCYPNPYKTTFTLKAEGTFFYQVYNASGVMVLDGAGVGSCVVGDGLRKGIYFLKVIQKDGQRMLRLIRY